LVWVLFHGLHGSAMKLFTIEKTAALLADHHFCEESLKAGIEVACADSLKAGIKASNISGADFESMKEAVLLTSRSDYLGHLMTAIESKKLPVRNPRTGLSYSPEVVREFYDLISFDDVVNYFQSEGLALSNQVADGIKNKSKEIKEEKSSAELETLIRPKIENSLLKMILGMAVSKYEYNPKSRRNKATGENSGSIAADLSRLGLDLECDTIRAHLNEAQARFNVARPNKNTP